MVSANRSEAARTFLEVTSVRVLEATIQTPVPDRVKIETNVAMTRCASMDVSIYLEDIDATVLSDSCNISTGTNASVCLMLTVYCWSIYRVKWLNAGLAVVWQSGFSTLH